MSENNNMTAFKTKVAEAMSPMLDVFHSIGEAPLHLVAYFYVQGCLERIVFSFGPTSLVVLADEDDARPFGWGYAVVNQQAYCDGLLLSFGDIRPKVLLQVIASSIDVKAISEFSPPSQSR
jgi:hypothetical protein